MERDIQAFEPTRPAMIVQCTYSKLEKASFNRQIRCLVMTMNPRAVFCSSRESIVQRYAEAVFHQRFD